MLGDYRVSFFDNCGAGIGKTYNNYSALFNINFQNKCTAFNLDNELNDRVRCMNVKKGHSVIIYEHRYFNGKQATVKYEKHNNIKLIKTMSSLVVGKNTTVSLYLDEQCVGELEKKYYSNIRQLYIGNKLNDSVRCLKVQITFIYKIKVINNRSSV